MLGSHTACLDLNRRSQRRKNSTETPKLGTGKPRGTRDQDRCGFGECLFQLDQRTPGKALCIASGTVAFSKSRISGSSEFSHHWTQGCHSLRLTQG